MKKSLNPHLVLMLLAMAALDGIVFQLGYLICFDISQNWELNSGLKYGVSLLWSFLFWSLWTLSLSRLRARRLAVWCSASFLTFVFVISLYFKAEFFHLPNINTYLFSLNETENTLVLIGDKATQWSTLLLLPILLGFVQFCERLLRKGSEALDHLSRRKQRWILVCLVALFVPVSALSLGWHRFAYPLTFDANAARIFFQHALMLGGNKSNLRHPTRLKVENTDSSEVNVLIILNESLRADALIPGLDFTRSIDPRTHAPRFQRLIENERFVLFREAYANSNATNVSVPSLLTGLPPHRTSTDFHTLPLAWNYAKAVGNQTFLFASQDWTWEHFDHFFFSRDIDHIFHRKSVPDKPLMNDLGVDDQLTFSRFETHLRSLDLNRPFFGVLQYNNTHPPFYGGAHSEGLEPFSEARYLSAVQMTDELIAKAIAVVEQLSSPRPTLVFITADHGEGLKHRKVGRHNNFFEDMVRVPFAVLVSPGLNKGGQKFQASLAASAGRAVQNIDIVPTLLDLWGLPQEERLSGHSLLKGIPEGRVISGMGTCEIRKWSPEGFYVRLGSTKLVVAERLPGRFYDLSSDIQELRGTDFDPQNRIHVQIRKTIKNTDALKGICLRVGSDSCPVPID